MIDPKFNEIEDKTQTGLNKSTDAGLPEATSASAKPRQGLSVNDTVAAGANLSVGSRGTDTSGVRAGSGAGAGSSYATAGAAGESPAPNVVPGPRGSGITPLSSADPDQIPTLREGEGSSDASPSSSSRGNTYGSSEGTYELSEQDIAAHAYNCWHERGCPSGSPEEDWHRAERELRERARTPKTVSASA